MTPYQLWEVKHGLREVEVTAAMKRGTDMEQEAREAYEALTGNKMMPKVVFHPWIPFMMSSLDGLNEKRTLALEIKNCKKEDHELARCGKIPQHYMPQLQHQMECLQHVMIHYWSYHNGEGILVEVMKDSDYVANLIAKEKEFYEEHMEGFREPPLSDKDYVQMSSPEWMGMAPRLKEIIGMIKELEREEETLRNALIEESGGHSAMGGGLKLTRHTVRGVINYKAIPELQGVDLEKHRKPNIIKWRIS